jgi:hypothetical protein
MRRPTGGRFCDRDEISWDQAPCGDGWKTRQPRREFRVRTFVAEHARFCFYLRTRVHLTHTVILAAGQNLRIASLLVLASRCCLFLLVILSAAKNPRICLILLKDTSSAAHALTKLRPADNFIRDELFDRASRSPPSPCDKRVGGSVRCGEVDRLTPGFQRPADAHTASGPFCCARTNANAKLPKPRS